MNIVAFEEFTTRWLAKAAAYRGRNLAPVYDKFFTLFVVYNRAYDEAARFTLIDRPVALMVSRQRIEQGRVPSVSQVGDRIKATRGVDAFCGASLRSHVFTKRNVLAALERLKALADSGEFSFFFDRDTGRLMPNRDRSSLYGATQGDVLSVLDFLYQVRCNLFHGQKGFSVEQVQVLQPANILLSAVTRNLVSEVVVRARV